MEKKKGRDGWMRKQGIIYMRVLAVLAALCLLPVCSAGAADGYVNSREQLSAYLRSCAYECREDVSFSYGSALAGKIKDTAWFSQVLYENGVNDASWRNQESRGYLEFTRISYYPEFYNQSREPIHWFSTWGEVEAFILSRSEERDTDFSFFYDASLALSDNSRKLSTILHSVGMDTFEWQISNCRVRVENVVYPGEFAVCLTRGEMQDYLSWCARYQVTDFALFLGEDLYRQMQANDFSALYALEGEARITSRELSYSNTSRAFYYKNVSYDTAAQQCRTLQQAMQVLRQGADQLQDEIYLFCTKDVYNQFVARDEALLSQVGNHMGMNKWVIQLQEGSYRILLHDIEYYPGHKMLCAYRMNRLDLLSAREYEALSWAVNAINQGDMPGDLLGAERWIHDFLCDRITYENLEYTEEDDSAVGALLGGQANCDGYADAFYLMGNLVGMEVRYQFGGDGHSAGEINHAWNLIRINDGWYMVDLTWNDADNGENGYIWYNVGRDVAGLSHWWNDQAQEISLSERTEDYFRPQPLYKCYSYDDLKNIIQTCKSQGVSNLDIFYGYGPDFYHESDEMYDAMRKAGVKGSIRSRWHEEAGFVSFFGLEY